MVEKNDQKKCRDISTEIQEILAKWGKYFFYYYPKEHRIRPSEFAARHMGIVENATDLEHSILMDRIMEKENLDYNGAKERVETTDEERASYYYEHTGKTWGDVNDYHMILDTSALGVENCPDILMHYFEKLEYI